MPQAMSKSFSLSEVFFEDAKIFNLHILNSNNNHLIISTHL